MLDKYKNYKIKLLSIADNNVKFIILYFLFMFFCFGQEIKLKFEFPKISYDVNEKLKNAEKFIQNNQYEEGIKLYLELLKNSKPEYAIEQEGKYIGVKEYIRKKIRNLPDETKSAYYNKIEYKLRKIISSKSKDKKTKIYQILNDYPGNKYEEKAIFSLLQIALDDFEIESAKTYSSIIKYKEIKIPEKFKCEITSEEKKLNPVKIYEKDFAKLNKKINIEYQFNISEGIDDKKMEQMIIELEEKFSNLLLTTSDEVTKRDIKSFLNFIKTTKYFIHTALPLILFQSKNKICIIYHYNLGVFDSITGIDISELLFSRLNKEKIEKTFTFLQENSNYSIIFTSSKKLLCIFDKEIPEIDLSVVLPDQYDLIAATINENILYFLSLEPIGTSEYLYLYKTDIFSHKLIWKRFICGSRLSFPVLLGKMAGLKEIFGVMLKQTMMSLINKVNLIYIEGDNIYCFLFSSAIVCIDTVFGEIKWLKQILSEDFFEKQEVNLGNRLLQILPISGKLCIIPFNSKEIVLMDKNGNLINSNDIKTNLKITDYDSFVIDSADEKKLSLLNLIDNKILWEFSYPKEDLMTGEMAKDVDFIYVPVGKIIYILDKKNGEVKSEIERENNKFCKLFIIDDYLYILTIDKLTCWKLK